MSTDIKQNIEATVKSYVTSFIDAREANDPKITNRDTTPDCLRSMLPSPLGGGGTMPNEAYEAIFAQGLKAGGMHANDITDLVIDVDARKAAVTTVATLVMAGEEISLDFSWFLHLNEDGTEINRIVEFVDSLTFTGLQKKMAGGAEKSE
ncbi:uncharacterized protein FIESC28_05635 [Fusarium coffeatum]|uniref:SnoaL-like domain-containing protein n=1 Tax=Fusarium coffeatum TaxID=231269 RepID=A0A366RRY5_9HYPO|nr:uncharacterized protein FIESC28_05635 [Fusarium coffeatum]RBR19170.1 hypothetical protein FIESC28_05635 [Fusarium coffeatum]